jgi:hypothetical protein
MPNIYQATPVENPTLLLLFRTVLVQNHTFNRTEIGSPNRGQKSQKGRSAFRRFSGAAFRPFSY